jgi:hypothetical protein
MAMWIDLTRPDILVVSRPKLDGIGKHFGVDFQDGRIVHLLTDGRVEFTTPDGFACGQDVAIEVEIPGQKYLEVQDRVLALMRNPRPYYLATWNCETFARWIAEGKAESGQVVGVLLLGLLAAAAVALR